MALRGAQNWNGYNNNNNNNNSNNNSNNNNNNNSNNNNNNNNNSNNNNNNNSNNNNNNSNNNVRRAAEMLASMKKPKEKQDGGEFPAPTTIPPLKRQNGYLPESAVPAGILDDADAGPGAASLTLSLPTNSRRKIAFEPTQTRKRGGRKTRRSRR